LQTDPINNLITATTGDFAHACQAIAGRRQARLTIVTGFTIPSADPPCGETDGPLGALYVARALWPLGIPVTIATDGTTLNAMKAGVVAADLLTPVVELPVDTIAFEAEFHKQVGTFNILLSIERVGPAADGRCYSMRGRDMTALTRPAHRLFTKPLPGVSTIAIGDGGNEIGMGKIPAETIHRNIPEGDKVACRVPADRLIVAGISNWGAYALATGIRWLRHAPYDSTLFDATEERRLLRIMVEAGPLIDGVTLKRDMTVDGLSFENYSAPLQQMGELVGAL
jgi:hypothetical protein